MDVRRLGDVAGTATGAVIGFDQLKTAADAFDAGGLSARVVIDAVEALIVVLLGFGFLKW